MSDDSQTNRLIIFAKLPEPGKVKTRLARDLGDKRAAEIYSALAKDIISRTATSQNYHTAVFYDPPDKKYEISEWLRDIIDTGSVSLIPQEGDILGKRISQAFERIFSSGAQRAVIIGTDCGGVSAEMIEGVFSRLKGHDAVIGPAEDGGYYLLGLRTYIPELFQEIDWSTERVLEQTLERAAKLGLKYELLQTLSDVDDLNDLNRLPGDLNL